MYAQAQPQHTKLRLKITMNKGKLPSRWQAAGRNIPVRVSARLVCETVPLNFVRHANRHDLTSVREQIKYFSLFLPQALAVVLLPIVLLLTLVFPERTFAQEVPEDIPDHATTPRFGGGWDCERGYRKKDGSCIAVKLPSNAYATDSALGLGWKCRRGFKEVKGACVTVDVPEHGYLTAGRGDTWKCARGFREKGTSCIAIKVPENGYLSASSYGSGWQCERGYQAVGDT